MRLSGDCARIGRRLATIVTASALCVITAATTARAELVTFATGRTMSIRAHVVDGDSLVFSLRAGGEMTVAAEMVSSIGPDEVPYPEPEVEAAAASPVPLPVPSQSLAVNPTFDPLITRFSAEQGVDASLVRAVIQVE